MSVSKSNKIAEIKERLTPRNPENDFVLYDNMGDDIRWLISRVEELGLAVSYANKAGISLVNALKSRIDKLEAVRLAAIPMMELTAYMDVEMQMKLGEALAKLKETK